MDKTLCLFDIDGTLLTSGGAGERALRLSVQDSFGIEEDLSTIELAGRTDSAIAHQILRRFAKEESPENISRFLDGYVHWLKKLLPETQGRLLPGIVPLLDALHARPDVVLALLTGNLQRGAELKLTHYGVWHYFEFGAYADDHHDRNELGHFARSRARERHGIEFPPEKMYVLGDTPHDIACARAIGAKAVAIATGSFNREQLASYGPDFLFDDLSDASAVLTALS